MSGPNTLRAQVSIVLAPTMSCPPRGAFATYISQRSSDAMVLPERTAPVQMLMRALACAIDSSCFGDSRGSGVAGAVLGLQAGQQRAEQGAHGAGVVGVVAFEHEVFVDRRGRGHDQVAQVAGRWSLEQALLVRVVLATEVEDEVRLVHLVEQVVGLVEEPPGGEYPLRLVVEGCSLSRLFQFRPVEGGGRTGVLGDLRN